MPSSGQITHGMRHTRIYSIFIDIKKRCYNKNSRGWKFYGSKGITCEWSSFEQFRDDMFESYGEHVSKFGEKQTTIERIDINGNYCKQNCRWATLLEQANNKKNNKFLTHDNRTMTISQWARNVGLNKNCIIRRLKRGWDVSRTLSEPSKRFR